MLDTSGDRRERAEISFAGQKTISALFRARVAQWGDRVAMRVVKMLRMDESAAIQDQWMAETEGKGTLIVWLAKLLQKNLDVKPSRESNVININYTGADPDFSAAVANGFAKAPENLVKQWQKMIFAYLQGRVNLKRVFLLIDSRHGIKKVDREIMEMLDKAAVTYQIILTKSDKISAAALAKVFKETQAEIAKHAAAYVDIIATSSEKGFGIDELRAEICRLAG